jgi:hypothetical protein
MSENNNNTSDNTSVTSDVPIFTEKSSNSSDGNAAVIDNKEFETLKTRMTELSNATLATVAAIDACIKPKDVVANTGGSKKRSSKSRRQNHKSKTTRSRKTRQSQSKR